MSFVRNHYASLFHSALSTPRIEIRYSARWAHLDSKSFIRRCVSSLRYRPSMKLSYLKNISRMCCFPIKLSFMLNLSKRANVKWSAWTFSVFREILSFVIFRSSNTYANVIGWFWESSITTTSGSDVIFSFINSINIFLLNAAEWCTCVSIF